MESRVISTVLGNHEPVPEKARLPRVSDGWVEKLKYKPTLNDLVQDVHSTLMDNEEYLRLLEATEDPQAVEGSLSADNHMAAQMIRQKAIELNSPVKDRNIASISHALNIVMRRYNLSRSERKRMLAGVSVPGNGAE